MAQTMIAIGIVTWMRHDRTLQTILDAIVSTHDRDCKLMVGCDSPESAEWCAATMVPHVGSLCRGVAANKNRIFAWFLDNKELEHLFLFEDDCWPKKRGWIGNFIAAHKALEIGAFCFQPEDMYGKNPSVQPVHAGKFTAVATKIDGMPMLSITRAALEKVGGMHPIFKKCRYGNEHSEFMRRLKRARQVPWSNCTLRGCEEWIDSIDYREWLLSVGKEGGEKRPDGDPHGNHLLFKEHQPKGLAAFVAVSKEQQIYHDPHWEEKVEWE